MADPYFNKQKKTNINDVLNTLNSKDIGDKINEIQANEQLIEELASAVIDNPQLASLAPKLAGDPRINQFLQDNPDMNRKQALQMKKQMNKAAHAKHMKMAKIEGCIINASRKLKSITIMLEDGEPSKKEISTHIGATHMHSRNMGNYCLYFDSGSKAKNKRVMKAFGNDITGSSVIILSKDGNLTTEEFEMWEKNGEKSK